MDLFCPRDQLVDHDYVGGIRLGGIWVSAMSEVTPGTLELKFGQRGDNFTLRNVMMTSHPSTLIVRSVGVLFADRLIATAISVRQSVRFQ